MNEPRPRDVSQVMSPVVPSSFDSIWELPVRKLVHLTLSALLIGSLGCSSSKKNTKKEQATAREPAEQQTSAQELFIQANEQLDKRNFEKAIQLYEKALDRDPERTDIYVNLAIALSKDRKFEEAVTAVQDAIAHGGKQDPTVYYTLGNIYQEHANYSDAIRAYRTSLAHREGTHLDTLVNIASSLMLMKELDKAQKAYEHIRQTAPDDPRPYIGLGLIHHSKKNHEKALDLYDQALRVDSEHPQAWYNRGDLLSDMERNQEATKSFRRYLEFAPDGQYTSQAKTRLERLKKGID